MFKKIYLDNNATTAVAPEVIKIVTKALKEDYANASSLHKLGEKVAKKLSAARQEIAQNIGAESEEIIFTGSGSEGNNLCLKGYCLAHQNKGKHLITSQIEHPSVIQTAKRLEDQGWKVDYLSVNKEGFYNLKELESLITSETVLVSLMLVNNEIGTVQDLKGISKICQDKGVALHTDAVQALKKIPFNVKELGLELASFSGHKIHVPKGIGFIYKRKDVELQRQIDGGGQEFKLRAGTENIPYILGLVKAMEIFSDKDVQKMKELQRWLIQELKQVSGIRINGPLDLEKRVCNNINFSVENMEGEKVLRELSGEGIFVSTGSACSSKSTKLSPVLRAINCPPEFVHGNVRVSISKYTTENELRIFIKEIKKIVKSTGL